MCCGLDCSCFLSFIRSLSFVLSVGQFGHDVGAKGDERKQHTHTQQRSESTLGAEMHLMIDLWQSVLMKEIAQREEREEMG